VQATGGVEAFILVAERYKKAVKNRGTHVAGRPFKVDEHRAERHAVRATIKHSLDGDDRALHSKVYGDPWKAPKDGQQIVDPDSKSMRK
jgi:hypothetical protein